jgi:hypothetical protein
MGRRIMAKLENFRQENKPGMKRFYVNDLDRLEVGWENGHPILRIDSTRKVPFSSAEVNETVEIIFIDGDEPSLRRFVERLYSHFQEPGHGE